MKIIICTLILTLLFITQSHANWQLGLGYNITTVNNVEKQFDIDDYNGLQAFYDWSDLSFGIEANYFHTSQRKHKLITMSLNYLESIGWVRYNFINKEKFKLYFSSGVGAYQEEMKIQVDGKQVKEKSEPQLLLPLALGGSYEVYKRVNLGAEYRIIRRVKAEYENFSLRTSLSYIF